MRGGPCCLTETPTHPDAAVACFSAEALSCTFMVAWAQPSPTCQVLRGRKLLHIYADLGNNVRCGHGFDSGNCSAQFHCFLVLAQVILNFHVQVCDLFFQKLQLLSQERQHPAMMLPCNNPCCNKSASHWQSLVSVFRPGTALTC